MTQRHVQQIFQSYLTNDGDGVKIRRVAVRGHLETLDPFLLLDEIASDDAADYIGGFPPHPHRGFETVTYMLEGAFTHKDHMGNEGHLTAGAVQWMTAGKGVIHSEMPEQDKGRLHGFQLWVNLPAKDKMQPARYQEFTPEQIPEVDLHDGGKAIVVAGELRGVTGPVSQVITEPCYFDIRLPSGAGVDVPVNAAHMTLVYVYRGAIDIGSQTVSQGELAQLSDGDAVTIQASDDSAMLFLSAASINEPIANHGPFVMNTREEIEQAIADYQNGVLTD